jgi:hypothetical protein
MRYIRWKFRLQTDFAPLGYIQIEIYIVLLPQGRLTVVGFARMLTTPTNFSRACGPKPQ